MGKSGRGDFKAVAEPSGHQRRLHCGVKLFGIERIAIETDDRGRGTHPSLQKHVVEMVSQPLIQPSVRWEREGPSSLDGHQGAKDLGVSFEATQVTTTVENTHAGR